MSEKKWVKLRKIIDKKGIDDFFINLILELGRRVLYIKDDEEDYASSFTEEERVIFKSLWEMDFVAKENTAYYYNLFRLFSDHACKFSPKILGAIAELILSFSNERKELRSFIILTVSHTFLMKEDYTTAETLLSSLSDQFQRNWQVAILFFRLKIAEDREDQDLCVALLTRLLEIYEARETEFCAMELTKSTLYWKLACIYLENGYSKKGISLLKKIVKECRDDLMDEQAVTAIHELAVQAEKEENLDFAIELWQWLCSINLPAEQSADILYSTGLCLMNLAKVERDQEVAENYLDQAHQSFARLEEKYPDAPEVNKISYKFLKRKNLEELKHRNRFNEHIWIFIFSVWLTVMIAIFIEPPLALLPVVFLAFYAAGFALFKTYLEKWFAGEIEV